MFQFAYNRADEFIEGKTGVSLNISGDQWRRNWAKAQVIYELVKAGNNTDEKIADLIKDADSTKI